MLAKFFVALFKQNQCSSCKGNLLVQLKIKCGWQRGGISSLVFFLKEVVFREYCRQCFDMRVLKFLQDLVISRLNVLLGVGTKNKLWGDWEFFLRQNVFKKVMDVFCCIASHMFWWSQRRIFWMRICIGFVGRGLSLLVSYICVLRKSDSMVTPSFLM